MSILVIFFVVVVFPLLLAVRHIFSWGSEGPPRAIKGVVCCRWQTNRCLGQSVMHCLVISLLEHKCISGY